MSVLAVRHVTRYTYRQAVSFGEHRMMLRPRDSYDQRLIEASITITPEPVSLRWVHDVFGNCVAIARFSGRATELVFDSAIRLEHEPVLPLEFSLAPHAETYPFTYGPEDMPDLLRSIERHYADTGHVIDGWARQFLRRDGPTDTRAMLTAMNAAIRQAFTYVRREEAGVQPPIQTLKLGSGSCRDFAVLMMEAVRSLGLATRFVSGYLHTHGRGHLGGGATHAWLEVYLPGAGWIEYDPTNGIVGNRDLIRVAVVRDPAQAVPLAGSYTGFPADSLGMTVSVQVTDESGEDGAANDTETIDPPRVGAA